MRRLVSFGLTGRVDGKGVALYKDMAGLCFFA